ncbi:MAG: hypothetical protein HC853_05175 [Anaerolineae bacterium]|nr:hypothetical protein [Anaerolineae bacterium]
MKRLILLICAIILTLTHLPAHHAHAARMGRGAQGWWIGHQGVVCRDGATLAWLWEGGGYGGSSSTVRLWEGSAGTGRLIAHAPLSPTIHSTAVQFDLDELGARGVFTSYAIRDVNWFPLLTPGAALAIEDPLLGVTINTTVQNCLLSSSHAPTIARGGAQTLTSLQLPSPSLTIPDDALRYRIEALPAHGSLTLNNIALVVGSHIYAGGRGRGSP